MQQERGAAQATARREPVDMSLVMLMVMLVLSGGGFVWSVAGYV